MRDKMQVCIFLFCWLWSTIIKRVTMLKVAQDGTSVGNSAHKLKFQFSNCHYPNLQHIKSNLIKLEHMMPFVLWKMRWLIISFAVKNYVDINLKCWRLVTFHTCGSLKVDVFHILGRETNFQCWRELRLVTCLKGGESGVWMDLRELESTET